MLTFFRRLLLSDDTRLARLELRLEDQNQRQSELLRRQQLFELRLEDQNQVIRELTQENAQLIEALMSGQGDDLPDYDQLIVAVKEQSRKKEIFFYNRRLAELKEQAAIGGINTPPQVIIEIEMIETTLETLELSND